MQIVLVNFTKNEDPSIANASLYLRYKANSLADNVCKILGQPWKTEMHSSIVNRLSRCCGGVWVPKDAQAANAKKGATESQCG